METKSLLIGIISFMMGGLIVSVAATTFEKERLQGDTMENMVASLSDKKGEEFDEIFIAEMIDHHEAAVDMARFSKDQAHHQEIKDMSDAIISAQTDEINQMKQWQKDWGYKHMPAGH